MQDSIKNRLLKRFVLMVVLPVLAVFMLMTLIYWLTMSHTITEQANSVLDEAGNAITGQFEQYEALLTFLEKDQDLLYAGEIASGANISADKKADLTLLLTGYADSIASVDRLSVQYRNGLFLSTDLLEPPPAASQLTAWYQDPLARPGQTICLSYRAGENPVLTDTPHYASSLAVCRTICDSLGHPVAVANLTIRGETLGDFLSAAYSQQGGQTYLVTAEGALVNSPLRFDELAGFDRRRYLETRRDLPGLPLTLVNFLPLRPFLSQQYLTLTLGILSGLVAMLFFVVHTRCTVREFVRPIEDLRELMRQAQLGNLDVAYHPDTRDEFADLADSFNQMVAEIKRLIAQVYTEQSGKRQAEIKALQATIKPHFLYNTLETIHWMARRYGADDIVEAVDALSDLFRAGFSANHELGTVESEFQHIESYLKIQKLRYHDILDYTLNMDPQTSQLPVMRTILQPIVENALYHGIKENDQPGRIEIVSRLEENSLILEVSDNGRGLTESQLEQLTAAIQRSDDMDFSSSHGLYNVQQRLRLSYGPDYGLSIQSKPNEGTRVTVRLPVMTAGQTPGAEQKQD